METVFWTSVLLVAYVYVGYPLLLAVWSAAAERPVRKERPRHRDQWPTVSVVVAVHNEARRLPARLTNLLAQDYPHPLDIVVVSDGSSDEPARAVAPFRHRGVRLIERPRGGKPAALNAGVAVARGEILVFADARQRFAADAIAELVANLGDPSVGGATGELVLDCENGDATASSMAEGVGLYWKYEKWLRRHESRVGSTLGATGAIYAIRRALWRPLPEATLLDDVLTPMRIVLARHRVVFDERARAFDRVSPDGAAEARRKTRTLAGNYQILSLEPRLLHPFRNPVWFQYVSHKLGRLLVPWALVAAFVASFALARDSWFYLLALILQLGFYGLAALGGWMERGRVRPVDVAPSAQPDRAGYARNGLPPISGGTRVKAG